MKKNIIFLGAPGAGKGTFAALLVEKKALLHISTGDIFRREIKNGTELGKKAKNYVESGGLVPDEIVADMVAKRLSEPDCKEGFILDGFPRTLNQAELLKKTGVRIDAVISFDANDDLLIKRLTARIMCRQCNENYNKLFSPPAKEGICDKCGGELYQRKDDSLETANSRLALYHKETAPLIDFYKKGKILFSLNSAREKGEVMKDLLKLIE
ncbi:MAG TPA: adenylate kinase [Lentisphaeria bacterium]|nr:MAG: adenylate kinase [Lentisphaerae bacterium GWF2_38_69]HBM15516.1 adenylate kinase [Lentisphaeria bacterium]